MQFSLRRNEVFPMMKSKNNSFPIECVFPFGRNGVSLSLASISFMSLFTLTLNIFDTTHTFVFAMKTEPGGSRSAPTVHFRVEFIQMWKFGEKNNIYKPLNISISFVCFFFFFANLERFCSFMLS